MQQPKRNAWPTPTVSVGLMTLAHLSSIARFSSSQASPLGVASPAPARLRARGKGSRPAQ